MRKVRNDLQFVDGIWWEERLKLLRRSMASWQWISSKNFTRFSSCVSFNWLRSIGDRRRCSRSTELDFSSLRRSIIRCRSFSSSWSCSLRRTVFKSWLSIEWSLTLETLAAIRFYLIRLTYEKIQVSTLLLYRWVTTTCRWSFYFNGDSLMDDVDVSNGVKIDKKRNWQNGEKKKTQIGIQLLRSNYHMVHGVALRRSNWNIIWGKQPVILRVNWKWKMIGQNFDS